MTTETVPATTAPATPKRGWVAWIRENLFNTWYNGLLTLILGGLTVAALWFAVRAVAGFDLTIIKTNLRLFMIGKFPASQLWRPWVSGALLAHAVGLGSGLVHSATRERAQKAGLPYIPSTVSDILSRFWPVMVLVVVILLLTETITPTIMVILVAGAGAGGSYLGRWLPSRLWGWVAVVALVIGGYMAMSAFGGVGWDAWGGLHLNLFLAVAGIAFAFPLGMLLALGRRSSLPVVRAMSVTYIEVVRGVPLIAILLFGAFAIGFLLPEGVRPSQVTRMLIAITAFEAAYIAEVIRGGLQAVPPGQTEASQALGLPPWKTMRLVVLPQALRATIPPMVGQFISLYKDTTLVAILGLTELLEASFIVNSQPGFLGKGLFLVTLAFAGLVFWVGSYTMSREARRLEKRLGVGER
ncbi:MAG: amino acid ABC transporter permease [Acidimicrobiia bacterium]